MATGEKQYGLVDPKTSKKITASDVFGNESDSGSDQGSDWLKKSGQKEDKSIKRQTKIEMQRALHQDPTVYQYDEIYDEMMQKKEEIEAIKVPCDRKPKYIQALLKSADDRKKENERRLVRQIQMEREAEGDIFKDKEEFITSSYKQKLEEFKKAEEEERKMEYIESIMDVSKQQDLGGFYRNLYKETVGKENNEVKVDNNGEAEHEKPKEPEITDEPKTERNYRKRSNSECNEADEKKSKQDSSSSSSDSDSSSDSSSTSSSSEDEGKGDNKEGEIKPKESNRPVDDEKNRERSKRDDKSVEVKKPDPKSFSKKSDAKEEKSYSRNSSLKPQKPDEKDRRNRNYRSSNYNDRDRNSRGHNRSQRDERSYRDRERERDRDRDRSRREDRRIRDGRDRRRSSSRRRRRSTSRSSDGRRVREKSRERRSERSRSRRRTQREMQNTADEMKKTAKDAANEVVKADNDGKKPDETNKPSIWEKRTVGAVFDAALERYYHRKAARGY